MLSLVREKKLGARHFFLQIQKSQKPKFCKFQILFCHEPEGLAFFEFCILRVKNNLRGEHIFQMINYDFYNSSTLLKFLISYFLIPRAKKKLGASHFFCKFRNPRNQNFVGNQNFGFWSTGGARVQNKN
jgi:hypothetical protein